ncbi:hypothetical protein JKP88DRAFT_219967 [Tribonema minus]|uniref:Uncharacterized protein n=1 Tax=Tribonema minus TaxID=303371 RepID=A0A836CFI0_9STRA|nr:hypothetical protein JKP88DRAFT_219967 [Tribonema minus]
MRAYRALEDVVSDGGGSDVMQAKLEAFRCTEVEEDLLCIQQRRQRLEVLRQQELEQLHMDASQREQELESKGAQLQQRYARKQQEMCTMQSQLKELDERQSSMAVRRRDAIEAIELSEGAWEQDFVKLRTQYAALLSEAKDAVWTAEINFGRWNSRAQQLRAQYQQTSALRQQLRSMTRQLEQLQDASATLQRKCRTALDEQLKMDVDIAMSDSDIEEQFKVLQGQMNELGYNLLVTKK